MQYIALDDLSPAAAACTAASQSGREELERFTASVEGDTPLKTDISDGCAIFHLSRKHVINVTSSVFCSLLTIISVVIISVHSGLAADAAAGEQVYKKVCVTCHSNDPGVNKTGPSLAGVYGRKAGSSAFPRYKGMVGADFTWNEELLSEYLQDPKAFVLSHTQNKTTAMTYALKDAQQRADVIAYLKTLK
jgi:cytochrome c